MPKIRNSKFLGIGTTFYGKCDRWLDGSYITTKWFVFLFIPVLPVASYRKYRPQSYWIVRVPLKWEHVCKGYLVTVSILFFLAATLLGFLNLRV